MYHVIPPEQLCLSGNTALAVGLPPALTKGCNKTRAGVEKGDSYRFKEGSFYAILRSSLVEDQMVVNSTFLKFNEKCIL